MRACEHGNVSTCPHDWLGQARLRGSADADPWETRTVGACDTSPAPWRSQVGPVLRRRNYETRVIRVGDLTGE